MKLILFFGLALIVAACRHTAPAPRPPTPPSSTAPECLNLGPDGDAGARVGACGAKIYSDDGRPCAICFYANGCTAGMVYCVDQVLACDDPRCATAAARRRRKP